MPQAVANPIISTGDARNPFRELLPEHLERMKLSEFSLLEGRIVNAQSAFYYDTLYAKIGVAIPANAKQSLFVLGKGETATQFGTSTSLGEKNEFHTNMISNGEFESGTNFIMYGAGVSAIFSADLATTVGENGQITAPNYSASTSISAVNNLLAALENLELRFLRGEDIKKRGPLKFWPAPPGVGLEGASGSPNGGFFQNGTRGLVQFDYPVVLGSGDRFQFDVANVGGAAWTPTLGFKIQVVIWGIAIKQQYPG